jgi:ABC-type uncharacterized transport system involved in gliding motility auxiliary subunit
MKSISRVLGIIGLISIAFGLGVGLYTGSFLQNYYVLVNLGLGIAFVLVSVIVNANELREGISGRSTKAGANGIVYAVAVLAIVVLINFIAARNHSRFDTTENKQYSLADASISLVKGLEKQVKVTGFFLGGKADPIEDLLDNYRFVNPGKFEWEIVDPDKRPDLAERYAIRANATLVVESGEERKTLTNVNPATLEESLTNAILGVSSVGKKTVCAVEGHGEKSFEDVQTEFGYAAAKQALEGENYAIKPLLLASVDSVPDDCTLLFIGGPERPFFASEAGIVDAYLEKGGAVYALIDPRYAGPLVDVLKKWGVALRDDLIVDKVVRLFEGETLGLQPIVTTYDTAHPITREFAKQTIFTQARSVYGVEAPEGYTVTELAKSSPSSWGETNIERLFKSGEVALEPGDANGPLALGVAVGPGGEQREGKAKLVVFGDADFANNRTITAFFNTDLFLNAANWLTDQEKQISIRPKGPRSSFVRLTDDQMATIFHLAVLIFPQLLLTLGIIIAWRRR